MRVVDYLFLSDIDLNGSFDRSALQAGLIFQELLLCGLCLLMRVFTFRARRLFAFMEMFD